MKIAVIGFNHMPGGTRTAYLQFLSFLMENRFDVGAISISDEIQWVPKGLAFHQTVPFTGGRKSLLKAAPIVAALLACKRFAPKVFIGVGLTRVGNILSRSLGAETFRICQDV